jgi:hypothetical protein
MRSKTLTLPSFPWIFLEHNLVLRPAPRTVGNAPQLGTKEGGERQKALLRPVEYRDMADMADMCARYTSAAPSPLFECLKIYTACGLT